MHFLIDENIPLSKMAFSPLGRCDFFPGHSFPSEQVKQDTFLIIRSVTKINSQTFTHQIPKWIGSATAGTDHIDFEFLKKNDIGFDFAPGSNANSVAEYVILALSEYALKKNHPLKGSTLGVVGCGEVGSRVIVKAQDLGMKVWPVDPPLSLKLPHLYPFVSLEQAFTADFVTLHVPLTTSGEYATKFFITKDLFDLMPNQSMFINTSRGQVIKESILLKAMENNIELVLDVFEYEPDLSPDLTQNAFFLTPHIAGYSVDAKLRGTQMLYDAAIDFAVKNGILKEKLTWNYQNSVLKEIKKNYQNKGIFSPIINKSQTSLRKDLIIEQSIIEASTCTFSLKKDTKNFKQAFSKVEKENKLSWKKEFHLLRKNYIKRFEWNNIFPLTAYIEDFQKEKNKMKILAKLGFGVNR